MKLHDLRPAPGSRTARTRVGRGIAAGKGKTAGRGTKGQNVDQTRPMHYVLEVRPEIVGVSQDLAPGSLRELE